MALITGHLIPQSGLAAQFSANVSRFRAYIAKRRVFRTTLNELSALSDRELSDLGLNRSVLHSIAWKAAFDVK